MFTDTQRLTPYLHSNMVRFIIEKLKEVENRREQFTFQYG